MQMKVRQTKMFGWKRSLPDHRDRYFMAAAPVEMPESVDWTGHCPAVYDQGFLGSCTANALAGLFEFLLLKQGIKDFIPSRLFVYYNERVVEGTVGYDAGAELKDGIKSINQIGVCDEKIWPYIEAKFTKKPLKKCFTQAASRKVECYEKIENGGDPYFIKQSLAQGFPFAFGFSVYENLTTKEVEATGVVPMPDGSLLGGHAVLAVGYNTQGIIFRNSWGTTWGKLGYGLLPWAYMTNADLVADCWNMRLVKAPSIHIINF